MHLLHHYVALKIPVFRYLISTRVTGDVKMNKEILFVESYKRTEQFTLQDSNPYQGLFFNLPNISDAVHNEKNKNKIIYSKC